MNGEHSALPLKSSIIQWTVGSVEGHAGAAQLWSMLRNESNDKLLHEDQKIPCDLKVTLPLTDMVVLPALPQTLGW